MSAGTSPCLVELTHPQHWWATWVLPEEMGMGLRGTAGGSLFKITFLGFSSFLSLLALQ